MIGYARLAKLSLSFYVLMNIFGIQKKLSLFRLKNMFSKMWTSVIVFLSALLLASGVEEDENPLFKPMKFAADFYAAVRGEKPTKNIIVSPLSVKTALGLLLMGAGGNAAQQILDGLHGRTNNRSVIADHFYGSLQQYSNPGALRVANKIYTRTGYSLKSTFQGFAQSQFKSRAESLDFADTAKAAETINSWVEERTEYKIKDLFSADDLDPDTRMVLVNAVHFKAVWKNPFDEEHTAKANFWVSETESLEVDMMYTISRIMYGVIPELDAKIGFLPCKETALHMMIILSNSRTGLDELEEKINTFDFSKVKDIVRLRWTQINLPKFKIETTVDLKTVLTKLGMTDMFSDAADFSDLLDSAERVKIDKAVHKAFINVDEKGTEAAAATGLDAVPMSLPPILDVDHPFFFAITTQRDVAFAGSVRKF